MFDYAANISLLFTEMPFADRFECAANSGFKGVEFAFPEELSPDEIRTKLSQWDLIQVLGNLPTAGVPKGLAAIAGSQDLFRACLKKGLEAAKITSCPLLHITAGTVSDHKLEGASAVYYENMLWAAHEAEKYDITLVIEAINQIDVPGYFIRSLDDAVAWIERIGHPRVRLLVDFYHAQMGDVDLNNVFAAILKYGAHLQIAGVPGRKEPDTGSFDYIPIINNLNKLGYEGWIGCEYIPLNSTKKGLAWLQKFRLIKID